jgi:hypothetical protein
MKHVDATSCGPLRSFSAHHWQADFSSEERAAALNGLEEGRILFLPNLKFSLNPEERALFAADYSDPTAKNISYHPATDTLRGATGASQDLSLLKGIMRRFHAQAAGFIKTLFPSYALALRTGRASYRPLEIQGRKTSLRKDDTRLHVDAFPSSPNQGKRILRLFCNIHPNRQDRVWRTGESFTDVARHFLPRIRSPAPGSARLLQMLGITKSRRTLYDHFMLQLHDLMKRDNAYQRNVRAAEIRFPAGSSWIVQTDHVSHAALSGQYLLEQTFYLPVEAMARPEKSPLRILEHLRGCRLA